MSITLVGSKVNHLNFLGFNTGVGETEGEEELGMLVKAALNGSAGSCLSGPSLEAEATNWKRPMFLKATGNYHLHSETEGKGSG